MSNATNIVWHEAVITRADRETRQGHRGAIIWFTGLSGSGKSTLANAAESMLHESGLRTFTLDGDNVRHGLCADLGFSNEDRVENIRRIGEVAKLMVEAGVIVLAAFISPFKSDRQKVRNLVEPGSFIEVFCDCDLEVCEGRDVKGLYKLARAGKIQEFTGISSPYEKPKNPELALNTGSESIEGCARRVADEIKRRVSLELA